MRTNRVVVTRKESGFTLVELAIVLVIIGLLVGGVLVGQDLIKAAEIRATASDIERFNTGAASFRTKYSAGFPGDLLAATALSYGLNRGDGTDGQGDGDGVLENNTTTKTGLGGENTLFWRQLSDAQMIPFGFSALPASNGAAPVITTAVSGTPSQATLNTYIPKLRIRDIGNIHAYGSAGLNYYAIGKMAPLTADSNVGNATGALLPAEVLTPREANGIDAKLDDGLPARGVVISLADVTSLETNTTAANGAATTPAVGICYDSTTGLYNLSSEDRANSIACILRIRAGY